jgi:hypothetical protein
VDGNIHHKEGAVLELTRLPDGIQFLEFSLDGDSQSGFFLGRSNPMPFVVVEDPQLVSLAHNKTCFASEPLILMFQAFGLDRRGETRTKEKKGLGRGKPEINPKSAEELHPTYCSLGVNDCSKCRGGRDDATFEGTEANAT